MTIWLCTHRIAGHTYRCGARASHVVFYGDVRELTTGQGGAKRFIEPSCEQHVQSTVERALERMLHKPKLGIWQIEREHYRVMVCELTPPTEHRDMSTPPLRLIATFKHRTSDQDAKVNP